MGFEGDDRMNSPMLTRVGCYIFKEMDFSCASGVFLCFLDDGYRCIVTIVCNQLVGWLFSGLGFTSAYHDVSIANVSKPRREFKHLLAFIADLRKIAAAVTLNNIGKMFDIRPATGAKKIGRARAGEALNWSPKTGTKTAIYSDLRRAPYCREEYYLRIMNLLAIVIDNVNLGIKGRRDRFICSNERLG